MMVLAYFLIASFVILVISELIIFFIPAKVRPNSEIGNDLVSLLLVVRNEEVHVERCLRSLLNQDYSNIEILIADDGSTDNTVSIMESVLKGAKHATLYQNPVTTPADQNAKALNLNFLNSLIQGSMIAVADGDCIYPSGWISGLLRFKPTCGIVSGVTGVESSKMEHLDWLLAIGRIRALNSIGFRTTAIGNNMLFDRQAYNATAGWASTSSHLTEDYELNRQIVEAGFDSVIAYNKEVLVISKREGFPEIFNQRKRWKKGANGLPFLLRLLLLLDSLTLLMATMLIIWSPLWGFTAFLSYVLSRAIVDIRFLFEMKDGNVKWLLAYQLYRLITNFTFLIYSVIFRRIEWKGRTFH